MELPEQNIDEEMDEELDLISTAEPVSSCRVRLTFETDPMAQEINFQEPNIVEIRPKEQSENVEPSMLCWQWLFSESSNEKSLAAVLTFQWLHKTCFLNLATLLKSYQEGTFEPVFEIFMPC